MAGKKEYTKEEKIKKEKTRLKGIFKNLDENKKKLVTPLIEKAAFMSVELDILQDSIQENGWTSEYQNGANQWGEKRSAEADTYIALSKNYTAVIKQLTELVPAAERKKSKLKLRRLINKCKRGEITKEKVNVCYKSYGKGRNHDF